ncbi:DUF4262 domain-containing protein [Oerskovia flava]|uniref:DUF4262 domain-containing protein n=1 Tax=Oerskovia flava TaxID=2986422 RepID=UPI00224045F4|nr:DUF4262 domain-containing protein [Oerskovia sp. JB1-3-2]
MKWQGRGRKKRPVSLATAATITTSSKVTDHGFAPALVLYWHDGEWLVLSLQEADDDDPVIVAPGRVPEMDRDLLSLDLRPGQYAIRGVRDGETGSWHVFGPYRDRDLVELLESDTASMKQAGLTRDLPLGDGDRAAAVPRQVGSRPTRGMSVREQIDAYGWTVVSVRPEDPSAQEFQYTVGLWDKRIPELIVYGLAEEAGGRLLDDVAERLLGGTSIPDGERIEGLLDGGYAPQLRSVVELADPLGCAYETYGCEVPVRQLVLPDKAHRMPWEQGFNPRCAQPALYSPAESPDQ